MKNIFVLPIFHCIGLPLMKMGPNTQKYSLRTFRNRKLISDMYIALKGTLRGTEEGKIVLHGLYLFITKNIYFVELLKFP